MTVDVQKLVGHVIGKEGGYSDHPADRGGPTRWGITQQVARAFGYKGDMRTLPRDTAVAIYTRRYWTDIGLASVAEIAPDVAVEMFDIGVNMGPRVAVEFLQRSLNALNREGRNYPDIAADGAIGAMTIASLKHFVAKRGVIGLIVLLKAVMTLRAARYIEIAEENPTQEAFLFGWLANRAFTGQFSGSGK